MTHLQKMDNHLRMRLVYLEMCLDVLSESTKIFLKRHAHLSVEDCLSRCKTLNRQYGLADFALKELTRYVNQKEIQTLEQLPSDLDFYMTDDKNHNGKEAKIETDAETVPGDETEVSEGQINGAEEEGGETRSTVPVHKKIQESPFEE